MDRDSLLTPLSWSACREAVSGNRLEVLGRSVSQQRAYVSFVEEMQRKHGSVAAYLLASKFGVEAAGDGEEPQYGGPDRLVLSLNDFPYHYEAGILHYILWKLGSALTEEEIKAAELRLLQDGDIAAVDSMWYINPVHLKSVLQIEHAHILLKTRVESAEGEMLRRYQHLIIPPTSEGLEMARGLLAQGGLVAFPTETVYGLGANALNEQAVLSIFAAKGRPLTDPLIVHVTDQAAARTLLELSSVEEAVFSCLSRAFWPGPLTIIAKADKTIPSAITANTGFVGMRVPAHPLAMSLLQAVQLPIAAPSANRFGHVSPTRASHVLADLGEKGVHVLHGELASKLGGQGTGESEERGAGSDEEAVTTSSCEHGIESTVAKIDGAAKRIVIFRQGAVTQQLVEDALRSCNLADWHVCAMNRALKMEGTGDAAAAAATSTSAVAVREEAQQGQEAPGQAITHYAPDVACFTVDECTFLPDDGGGGGDDSTKAAQNSDQTLRLTAIDLQGAVVIDFHGRLASLLRLSEDRGPLLLAYRELSTTGSSKEGAKKLFDYLRWAEALAGAKLVFLARVPLDESTLALGLQDRMFRACSGVTKKLVIVPACSS